MSLKVDLKSKEQRKGVSFDYGWIFVLLAVLVAFFLFYAYGVSLKGEVTKQQGVLQGWQQKVAGFQGIQGQLQNLQGDINAIMEQINKLRELRYDPLRYSILLVRISKLLPSNIFFSNLSIEPSTNGFTLSGMAVGQVGRPPLASIADFMMALQNDKNNYFSNVILQNTSSSGKSDAWQFNLKASYNIPLITNTNAPTGGGVKHVAAPVPGAKKMTAKPKSVSPAKIKAPSTPKKSAPSGNGAAKPKGGKR